MSTKGNKHQKSVCFIRHYNGYTGGHQKVRDYMQHFIELGWQTSLYVDGNSATVPELFKEIKGVNYQQNYDPTNADIVFLAGMDWQDYLSLGVSNKKVINLIQHVRHADSISPLHKFLTQPAVRICVSNSVKSAIAPYANGPIYTIPIGHHIPKYSLTKDYDLYILANKQPELGERLANHFKQLNISVKYHNKNIEREAVLKSMASSRISVTLPHATEGFYLPGIEAMALSDIAVVPDCVASIEYTSRFNNALRCSLNYDDILSTINVALRLADTHSLLWIRKSVTMMQIKRYSLRHEQQRLENLLKKY